MAQPAFDQDAMDAMSLERHAVVRSDRISERFDQTAGQTLHFPKAIIDDVQQFAERLDRSVGWCMWMAWCLASLRMDEETLAELQQDERLVGPKQAERIELPLGTWRHLTRQAERLDRSKSWLVARAWIIARPRFLSAVR
jgi:predicted transcriptional regulator